MATGDFILFEEFALSPHKEEMLFGTDILKVALLDNVATPLANHATPVWSEFSANEVSGTNYVAGGQEISTDTWTEADGVASLAGDDMSWAQDVAGFDDAYWAIVYNTVAGICIGFIELGGPVGNVAGDFSIEWTGGIVYTHDVT